MRATVPALDAELARRVDALIEEPSSVLRRRFAVRGAKKEARGQVRSFCVTSLVHPKD